MNTYTKDEQVKLDTFTLRQLFDEKEISYEFVAKKFVRRAIMEMEKMPGRELDYIARNDPDIYEVFVRLGGTHPRATASGAAGTSSAAEEVPVCSSGASSSRSSVSTSVSSGGSTSRSS